MNKKTPSEMGQTIILIVTGTFLIMLGWLIQKGKYYNLIAGYNTMPEEEKRDLILTGLPGY